jgi:hypothetical protein
MGSGPSGMRCQKCRSEKCYFEWKQGLIGFQTYPYPCTPAYKIMNKWMLVKVCHKYKTKPRMNLFDGMNKHNLTIEKKPNMIC